MIPYVSPASITFGFFQIFLGDGVREIQILRIQVRGRGYQQFLYSSQRLCAFAAVFMVNAAVKKKISDKLTALGTNDGLKNVLFSSPESTPDLVTNHSPIWKTLGARRTMAVNSFERHLLDTANKLQSQL